MRSFGRDKRTKMFYTYILLCSSSKTPRKIFYVGSSDDLKRRFDEHRRGKVKTTKIFDKIFLVYYEACRNKTDARKRELQLKTGFGRGYINKRIATDLSRAGFV